LSRILRALIAASTAAAAPIAAPAAIAQGAGYQVIDNVRLAPPEDPLDAKVRSLIAQADRWTGSDRRRPGCDPAKGDTIVVCGRIDDDAYRVPADPEGLRTKAGVPDAPNVSGLPTGGLVIGFGYVPPPAYLIDFSKLPEVDEAYLARARAAEAEEKARQAREGR